MFNTSFGRDYSNYKAGQVVATCRSIDCFFDNKSSHWWKQRKDKIKGIVDVLYVITAVEKDMFGNTRLSLVSKAFEHLSRGYVSDEKLEDWQLPTVEFYTPDINDRLKKRLAKEVSGNIGEKYNRAFMEKEE